MYLKLETSLGRLVARGFGGAAWNHYANGLQGRRNKSVKLVTASPVPMTATTIKNPASRIRAEKFIFRFPMDWWMARTSRGHHAEATRETLCVIDA
jgi:hypothetical protein